MERSMSVSWLEGDASSTTSILGVDPDHPFAKEPLALTLEPALCESLGIGSVSLDISARVGSSVLRTTSRLYTVASSCGAPVVEPFAGFVESVDAPGRLSIIVDAVPRRQSVRTPAIAEREILRRLLRARTEDRVIWVPDAMAIIEGENRRVSKRTMPDLGSGRLGYDFFTKIPYKSGEVVRDFWHDTPETSAQLVRDKDEVRG
ncbi:hypothetical protein JCM10212_006626 [Sporobolomyces blumeae]